MELTNILIIASGIVLILLIWIIVGVRHLKSLWMSAREKWNDIDKYLRKRQDVLPNLIETIRKYDQNQEKLIENLIKERMLAAKEYLPGAKKIEYEYFLSKRINEVIVLERSVEGLSKDTNFLELRKEIDDLEHTIEVESAKYNELVRLYNKNRKMIFLRPLSFLFGYKVMNIFEVEV